jgi:hypothetical protein
VGLFLSNGKQWNVEQCLDLQHYRS